MLEDMSNDELIALVKQLRGRKKYGLVWEEKTEDVVERCKIDLPVLREENEKEILTNEDPINILIEGDNYHVISVLNYTHRSKIDVIYIDPPFNTGNKSWKYNNQYIEKDDSFKHSKWISFMNARLKLSRSLLTDDGIIMVAIDDYECHTLRLLLDEIFGEQNRLGTIVVVHNPGGRSDDKFIATSHEYMLIYAKNRDKSKINPLPLTPEQIEEYRYQDEISRYKLQSFMRTGSNSRPEDRPNLYYPIYYNPQQKVISLKKESANYIEILPIGSDGQKRVWRWGSQTVAKNKDTEFVVNKTRGRYTIRVKKRFQGNASDGKKPKTFWIDPKYNASTHGTILLQNILRKEKPFNYPKSIFTVIDALTIGTKKDSIVLDFFAGSGTTGHAVLELNKRDGGNRRFILCTNNENKICDNVCYPRLEKVIKGYKNKKNKLIQGLDGNLKYYHTEFVPAEPTDNQKLLLTKRATEILCLKEDAHEKVEISDSLKVYKNKDKFVGILFDEGEIPALKDLIIKNVGTWTVYIFSLGDDTFEDEFQNMEQKVSVFPIPEAILKVYRRIFR